MRQHLTLNYRHSASGHFKGTFISDLLLLLWHEYFILLVSSIAMAYFIFLCKPLLRVTCICLDELVSSVVLPSNLCPAHTFKAVHNWHMPKMHPNGDVSPHH